MAARVSGSGSGRDFRGNFYFNGKLVLESSGWLKGLSQHLTFRGWWVWAVGGWIRGGWRGWWGCWMRG